MSRAEREIFWIAARKDFSRWSKGQKNGRNDRKNGRNDNACLPIQLEHAVMNDDTKTIHSV